MISESEGASSVFPEVVKTIVCPDTLVQRLVYTYLMHYAELKPEESLLAINTFQVQLKNVDPLIRTQALRTLTSIRLSVIVKIQILAIQSGIRDSNPYVRKASLHSVVKVFSMAPKQIEILIKFIEIGLADPSIFVVSSAFAAFWELCPDRFDLIHQHFERYCNLLLDFTPWGQIFLLNILTHYIRNQFTNPNVKKTKDSEEEEEEECSEDSEFSDSSEDYYEEIHSDLMLLFQNASKLLYSSSSAVVSAAATLIFYCAPDSQKFIICRPILRLVREKRTSFMALQLVRAITHSRPVCN